MDGDRVRVKWVLPKSRGKRDKYKSSNKQMNEL